MGVDGLPPGCWRPRMLGSRRAGGTRAQAALPLPAPAPPHRGHCVAEAAPGRSASMASRFTHLGATPSPPAACTHHGFVRCRVGCRRMLLRRAASCRGDPDPGLRPQPGLCRQLQVQSAAGLPRQRHRLQAWSQRQQGEAPPVGRLENALQAVAHGPVGHGSWDLQERAVTVSGERLVRQAGVRMEVGQGGAAGGWVQQHANSTSFLPICVAAPCFNRPTHPPAKPPPSTLKGPSMHSCLQSTRSAAALLRNNPGFTRRPRLRDRFPTSPEPGPSELIYSCQGPGKWVG